VANYQNYIFELVNVVLGALKYLIVLAMKISLEKNKKNLKNH
jgi:hypothetical protein